MQQHSFHSLFRRIVKKPASAVSFRRRALCDNRQTVRASASDASSSIVGVTLTPTCSVCVAAAEHDATQRADVAVITAPGERDMAMQMAGHRWWDRDPPTPGRGHQIESQACDASAPTNRGCPGGRLGQQISAHIPRSESQRSQDLADVVASRAMLVATGYVDPERIGITGEATAVTWYSRL